MGWRLEALEAAQQELIRGTRTKAQQVQQAEKVVGVISGLPVLGTEIDGEDSEDFAREVIAKSSKASGKEYSTQQVEEILRTPLGQLSDPHQQAVANLSIDSFSTSALGGDPASNTLSLATVSAESLEDGKLSAAEARAIAVSAAKTAGSAVAVASGTLAMGPLGAVAAVPTFAFAYLGSEIAEEAELRRLGLEIAKEKLKLEERAIDAFLEEMEEVYRDWRRDIWDAADYAISDVAQEWHRYERELGVEIDLRYFPGEAPPPRGGLWQVSGSNLTGRCVAVPAAPGGSLYFPVAPDGKLSATFVSRLAEKRQYLTRCSTGWPKKVTLPSEHRWWYAEHAYFKESIRAFNSLMPVGGPPFWVPEGSSDRNPDQWKGYVDLVVAKYEGIMGREVPTHEAQRRYLDHHAAFEAAKLEKDDDFPAPPDLFKYAEEYSAGMFLDLFEEQNKVVTLTTKVMGDLIQTASAIKGEIEVSKQLQSNGLLDIGSFFTSLTQADKREVVFHKLSAGNPLNPLMLVAGFCALGYAGYKHWRRRG